MNRKLELVSETIGELLVKQLAHELKNYNLYMSFANYFGVEGIDDLKIYYEKRANEELNHHKWIYDYLTEADYKFIYPVVIQNDAQIEDYITPFKATIDREIQTTQLIYTIYKAAQTEGDIMTVVWLENLLIREQIEEENISRQALTIIEEESDIYERAEQILNLLE